MSATAFDPGHRRLHDGQEKLFNGVKMPAIAIRELDGSLRTVREFSYTDYEESLS